MKISKNVSLKHHSSFNLGGNTDYFVSVSSSKEAKEAVQMAKNMKIPYLAVGEFSNILFSDEGFRGLIIKNKVKGYEFSEKDDAVYVAVGAGENWDDFVSTVVEQGLHGVENLSGIPGSVGATPIQNVGAYGVEVANIISWVEALNTDTLEVELLTNKECGFGYRDSFFKTQEGKKYIVLKVGFKLYKDRAFDIEYKDLKNYFNEGGVRPTLESVRKAILSVRFKKFPNLNRVGCGGSFFKNPIVERRVLKTLQEKYENIPHFQVGDDKYKIPLAWILEHVTHWKGVSRGTVGVYKKQPLVLVHFGGGTSSELKKLSDEITYSVSRETNILISSEVLFVGNF